MVVLRLAGGVAIFGAASSDALKTIGRMPAGRRSDRLLSPAHRVLIGPSAR